jgi:hypothetical protein
MELGAAFSSAFANLISQTICAPLNLISCGTRYVLLLASLLAVKSGRLALLISTIGKVPPSTSTQQDYAGDLVECSRGVTAQEGRSSNHQLIDCDSLAVKPRLPASKDQHHDHIQQKLATVLVPYNLECHRMRITSSDRIWRNRSRIL